MCNGKPVNYSPGPPATGTYLWSTGSSSAAITVNTAGLYWLQIENNGCIKRDSVNLVYKAVPVIDLGRDTTLCVGDTRLLDVSNNGDIYTWQDGTSTPVYLVNKPGKYSVKVSKNGCAISDSISFLYQSKPMVNLGSDTAICIIGPVLLNAQFPNSSYLWQDGTNRTIKEEFGMDRKMKSKEQVKKLVEESIFLYNQKRPHLALQMQTPEQVYTQKIPAT